MAGNASIDVNMDSGFEEALEKSITFQQLMVEMEELKVMNRRLQFLTLQGRRSTYHGTNQRILRNFKKEGGRVLMLNWMRWKVIFKLVTLPLYFGLIYLETRVT
jgi:hypothetical protein